MQKQNSENFETLLKDRHKLADNCPLKKLRRKAWDRYLQLGLPTKKTEVYRYVKLRSLFAFEMTPSAQSALTIDGIRPYILPECEGSVLVFANGRFDPALSQTASLPGSISVLSLEGALRSYSTFLSNHWMKTVRGETDPFSAVNAALHQGAAFIYIPPKAVVNRPIQILNVVDNENETPLSMPRLQAFIGAQAEANFAVTHAILHQNPYAINHVNDFHIEEGAKVSMSQMTFGENDLGWQLEATRAALKRDSAFHATSTSQGSLTSRFDYRVDLLGENAETHLQGLSRLEGKREAHHNIHIVHHAPNCRSNQLFKNCLSGSSHSSFEGKIYVHKIAQKTEAYQLNANLLLDEGARAESKPNLEIFADDVRASHGATFGQLDKEQIFYLRTRGMTEEAAKNALVSGFCRAVIETLSIPSLKKTH